MVRVEPTQDGVFEHLFSAIDLLTALRRCGNYFVIRDLGLAYGRLCSELWSTWAVHSGLKAQAIGLRLTKILAGNGNAQADYLLAHMLKNAGGPMADLGREATAVRLFMQSAEGFNQLQSRVSPSSLVRLFECKSLCNAGTALCRLDQYDRASRLVNLIDEIHERDPAVGEIGRERAMAPQFLKLSATVASGLGDRIRAQSMLDQSVQDLAKASGLKGTFWGGMAFWPTLANHTGAAIVNAWAAACDSSHKAKIDLPTQALLFTSASKALEVMQLLPALMPRADSLHAGKVAADLVAGLGWLAELGMVNSPLNWISIRSDFARLTVDLVGNWLRKALPEDLHSTEPVIELILHRLTGALVAIDDTALIAHGFLSSQGLRSQHLAWHGASAAADAARVWHEIDELDRAGLGSLDRQGQMASFPLGLDASWLDATALSSSQRREQRRALLGNLFQAGTAEPPVPLDLATVQQRLPRGQALLMLLRAASGLLVVVVTCDTSGALGLRHVCLALAPGASADCRLDLSLVDLGLLQEQAGAVRKAPIRDAGCTRGVAREDESSKDVDTVAAHSRLALLASALTPTLSELMRQGFTLCLIPSGDLHVLPWHHFVQHQCGDAQALRVFATVTDWWRLHDPESPVNGAEEPPRWLMAAYDAHDTGDLADRLCWVPVEASLSGSLWTSAHLRAVDPQSEIRPQADAIEANALLACGHSLAPGGNAALAGVWVGTVRSQGAASRIPQVLSARDLKQVPSVRRLLLSCCVLGRTDGVFGEPLGLIAQAFNHGAEFALGSLVQLGDMEATLFSLAYQWSLSQAYAQSPCVNVDWVHVFVQVQTQIGQGRWPEGFGDWLGQHLPGVLGSVIPSVEAARTQDQAWELRQSWQRILGSLCSDWDLPAPPQASRTLAPTICAVARVLAKSPSARLSRLATWMVVYGVGEQRVRPR